MAHVLCTGADRTLMETRKLILERAGHAVTTARSEQEVRDACADKSFDVVVIGQPTVLPEKRRILDLVRQLCPGVKVLDLHYPNTPMLDGADASLEVPGSVPGDLPERVAELASRPTKGQ